MADNVGKPSSRLAPGFRFHPTDEELVRYYLRRKVCGKPFHFDAISEIDIYKSEPWDLPAMSLVKTRDLEWYFFSVLDKKYGNGSRTNRATQRGYWKTTGKDRAVYHKLQIVGMKKTLVYHTGRAPSGVRSNWVMHEYRLVDVELEKAGIVQDAFVLCRVFQKSGSGPKNGEQYGAPFIEEEWEDDELETFPKEEVADEVVVSNDAFLDETDLEQIFGECIPIEGIPLPLNYCHGGNDGYVEESINVVDDAQKPLLGMDEIHCGPEQLGDQRLFNMPVQNGVHVNPVKNEYIGEASNTKNHVDVTDLLDESFWDATDNPLFDGGAFLEANDLANPIEADASGLDLVEEYLTFNDADGNNTEDNLVSDSSKMMGSENVLPGQISLSQKNVNGENGQVTETDVAASSKQDPTKNTSAIQYPFVEQATRMLGNIPAPPAFASEFPMKDVSLYMNSDSQSSSSFHVTAGMMQIGNMNSSGSGMDLSVGKHGDVNIILSFGLSRGNESSTYLESMFGIHSCRSGPAMARNGFYLIFFWVLVLSMSFKIGTYVCASQEGLNATVEEQSASVGQVFFERRSGFDSLTGVYHSLLHLGNHCKIPTRPDLDIATFVLSQFPQAGQAESRVALVDSATNKQVTYAQLQRSISSLATGLYHGLGVRKGDVVFVLSPNSLLYPTICLAVLSVGAILTTANPLNTGAEIAKQVHDSGAKLAIAAPEAAAKLLLTGVPTLLTSRTKDENALSVEELIESCEQMNIPQAKPTQSDTAALLYSSGTTGTGKGVILTHENIIAIMTLLKWCMEAIGAKNDVFLCFIPMFHIYGLAFFALGLFSLGTTTVVMQRFDFQGMLHAIETYKVGHIPAVPPVILALVKYIKGGQGLSSLRRVGSGAALLSKEVANGFRKKFPWIQLRPGYGLTESSGAATFFVSSEEAKARPGSSGMLLPSFSAKVVDMQTGLALPPYREGELWLKSPTVMKGYLCNEEATAATIDSDGWLRTGDLCYIDEDGFLYIVDRIKELIKHNGYQVAPAELEAILLNHPHILDAAVIPQEDEEVGQIPMAFVVRAAGSELSEEQVIQFVAGQVCFNSSFLCKISGRKNIAQGVDVSKQTASCLQVIDFDTMQSSSLYQVV